MYQAVELLEISGIRTELLTAGQGQPLLFLHSGEGPDLRSRFLNRLAERYRVFAPSHPGFGNSELPQDFKTVDDLAYFYLDFIKAQKLRQVILVGASFGGWIAAEIAVRDRSEISSLVLVDPVGVRFETDPTIAEIADIYMISAKELAERSYARPFEHALDIDSMSDDDLVVHSRNRLALCQFAWSPYMHNPRLRRWLHRIDVPTLLLWGEEDLIVTPEYGRKWAQHLPNALLRTLGGVGHHAPAEAPDRTAELIFDFNSNLAPQVRQAV